MKTDRSAAHVGQASRLSRKPALPPTQSGAPAGNDATKAIETGGTPVLPFMPFDPSTPIAIYGRHLPHWRQAGCTYFITFRLADSIPQSKLNQWKAELACWLRAHPEPHSETDRREYHDKFTERFHHWLDAGHGACRLRHDETSAVVEAALQHFDGERYLLSHYVVMPNHVHLLVRPVSGFLLSEILHSWKSFTAHRINRLLNRRGTLWQDESFDHIVRNGHQLEKFAAYILENPVKAGLKAGEYHLGFGSQVSGANVGQASRLSRTPALPPTQSDRPAGNDATRAIETGGTPVLRS